MLLNNFPAFMIAQIHVHGKIGQNKVSVLNAIAKVFLKKYILF